MNKETIIKLLTSNNEDDILLGYTLLRKTYNHEEINELVKPMKILMGWDNDAKNPTYIKVLRHDRGWLFSDWIKIIEDDK